MTRKPPPNASTWTAVSLIALGMVMIFLGWNGAAGPDAVSVGVAGQFPYLISGGVFGLALVGAGLALVRTAEARKDAQRIVRQLEQLTQAVEELAAVRPDLPVGDLLPGDVLRGAVPAAGAMPAAPLHRSPRMPAPAAFEPGR